MNKNVKRTTLSLLSAVSFVLVGCANDVNATSSYLHRPSKDSPISSSLKRFEGVVFESKTFPYDGLYHSLAVENVPSFADITYENNNKIEVGTHEVKATISAQGYETLVLSATLTIEKAELKHFENLSMDDLTIPYDGEYHSLVVNNLPSFAKVIYDNNNKKAVGVYTVGATISASGYETLKLKATLTILGLDFSGITFEDATFEYNGRAHTILANNVPSFARVAYSNNSKTEKGTYSATATITADGYNTLVLKATLKIVGPQLPKYDFPDRVIIYNGKRQLIETDDIFNNKVFRYANITKKLDGKVVDEFYITDIGEYHAQLIVEVTGYETSVYDATFKIVPNTWGVIDESKSSYQIRKDVKFQELYEQILKGNFTLEVSSFSERFDNSTHALIGRSTVDVTTYYVTPECMFTKFDNGELIEPGMSYHVEQTNYSFVTKNGNDVVTNSYIGGALYETSKYPLEAYEENTVGRLGMMPFALMSEGENGEFVPSSIVGYTTGFGSISIDEKNNSITVEKRNHNYHSEFQNDEVSTYTYRNIGNTKVNIPDSMVDTSEENMGYSSFYLGGISYSCFEETCSASVYLDEISTAYLAPGTYTLLPEIYGKPIKEITQHFYSEQSIKGLGYSIRTFFDDNGYYQGEYENLGYVKGLRYLSTDYEDNGGNVLYYADWH